MDEVWKDDASEVELSERLSLAEGILRGTGIDALGAARMVLDILEQVDGENPVADEPRKICREVISCGLSEYSQRRCSVSFRVLVESVTRATPYNRPRSRAELLQYCRRMVRVHEWLAGMPVRLLKMSDCAHLIETCWETNSTRNKARRILHRLMSFAVRHGWADDNPVAHIEPLPVKERRICPLSLRQVRRLLETLCKPEHRYCAPAVGLMLWAGIRPSEVERLCWGDVDLEKNVVYIAPEHAKTGGARQVSIQPVLKEWLLMTWPVRLPCSRIVPRAWLRRWREVRTEAGFTHWVPDVLRHTFASYHILHFRNLHTLQLEMGHSSMELLRTRYIGLDGISRADAALFWGSVSGIKAYGESRKSR